MSHDLKHKYKQAHDKLDQLIDYLDDVVDNIEDEAEDLVEETQHLWRRTRDYLQRVQHKLDTASRHLPQTTDEAMLQARLAEMEANEYWDKLSATLELWTRRFERHADPYLNHAELQIKLAEMDARDFITDRAETFATHSAALKEKLKTLSHTGVDNIKQGSAELLARFKQS